MIIIRISIITLEIDEVKEKDENLINAGIYLKFVLRFIPYHSWSWNRFI